MACSPACVKNILNTGLIAPLATELADMLGGKARAAALSLAGAANSLSTAYVVLVRNGIIAPVDSSSWVGCDQASLLSSWIEGGGVLPQDAADTMAEWTGEMRQITASLVSGQFSVE